MMKKLGFFIATLVILLTCVGCFNNDNDLTKIEKQTGAYAKFTEVKQAKEPDLPQLKSLYQETLSGVVEEADSILPGLKNDTDSWVTKVETEENKDACLEGVEKRLQLAFVTLMKKSLDEIESNSGDTDPALKSFRKANAYFAVIDITGKRRGAMFNDENKFHNQFASMFNGLEKSVKKKDVQGITGVKNQILNLTDRVYFLSVLFEIKGLIELRGKDDPAEIFAKQVEASSYFKIIRDSIDDEKALEVINTEFAKPATEIDAALIKENLKYGYREFAVEFKDLF
jgi:hypothetical protein